jgi:hypothetical protein
MGPKPRKRTASGLVVAVLGLTMLATVVVITAPHDSARAAVGKRAA